MSLHEKRAPNDPLDRCGITFYVRIKLDCNASMPSFSSDSVSYDTYPLQLARFEAYVQSLHPSMLSDLWKAPITDPRRRMFIPLKHLLGVQSVEVERCWTVCYRRGGVEDESVVICAQPLQQLWRFRTVGEMLEKAGTGFCEFLDPALEYLQASDDDVVEIIENTTEDVENRLIA